MRDLILDELFHADRLTQKHLDGFVRDGVDLVDLAGSGIRHARILVDGDRFEFARHARGGTASSAFVWPCLDDYARIADIAGWRPGRSVSLWLGNVGLLGQEQVNGPRLCEPLTIHADVLSWFRAKRQGIFIIDFARAADLLRCETLGAQDVAYARLLRAKLTVPAPPIVIVQDERGENFSPLSRSQPHQHEVAA